MKLLTSICYSENCLGVVQKYTYCTSYEQFSNCVSFECKFTYKAHVCTNCVHPNYNSPTSRTVLFIGIIQNPLEAFLSPTF